MAKKILLGITTTSSSDWREKIKETDSFKINEIALFLTCLNKEERKEIYELLKKSSIVNIPHVHIKSDMEPKELEYLRDNYQTKIFNVHSEREFSLVYDLVDFLPQIYVENTTITIPDKEDLAKFAGLCIDFAHWENGALGNDPLYKNFLDKVEKYKIGCCHISAIKKNPIKDDDPNDPRENGYDSHWLNNLSELDYIKKYLKYLPDIISLELENSFREQIKAKKYLEKVVNNY